MKNLETAYGIGAAFRAGLSFARGRRMAQEEKDYLQKNGLWKTKLPSSAAFQGNQVTIGGSTYRVAEIRGGTRINADDPSIHGSHLLGEEDTAGKWVYLKPIRGG